MTEEGEVTLGDYKFHFFSETVYCEDREDYITSTHPFNKQCLYCGKRIKFGDNHFDVDDNFQVFTCKSKSKIINNK